MGDFDGKVLRFLRNNPDGWYAAEIAEVMRIGMEKVTLVLSALERLEEDGIVMFQSTRGWVKV